MIRRSLKGAKKTEKSLEGRQRIFKSIFHFPAQNSIIRLASMSTDINIECGRGAALSRDVQHINIG
jgi:hypothetical protein